MFANILQEIAAYVSLCVSHYALFMAWSVNFKRHLAIKPNATLTLVGITIATYRSMR